MDLKTGVKVVVSNKKKLHTRATCAAVLTKIHLILHGKSQYQISCKLHVQNYKNKLMLTLKISCISKNPSRNILQNTQTQLWTVLNWCPN